MPALEIPKKYERGFVLIRSFTDTDFEQILKILGAATPASEPSDILPSLRTHLPDFPADDVQKFLDTIYSLYMYRSHADAPIDEFVADLSEAIRHSANKDLQTADPAELALLGSRLKSLLGVRPLSILSKAHGLRTDFANIFSDAKVISDIRPIWDGAVTNPPEGVVITQTLKLEYSSIDGSEELYLYLDKDDIALLISVLTRAQEKIATLESLSGTGWMKILD